ncbi:MAG: hypothetical protein DMF78_25635, partial [Acidobacteria bacterium]
MRGRREFLSAGAALSLVPRLAFRREEGLPAPPVADRLDQGPFGIEQDEGWYTVATTTVSSAPVRNFGLGLVGYTWEENGPALAVRRGAARLEDAVERLAALPFVDVLYIRCDWRDVQSRPGRLDLAPVWAATLDAARRHGLGVGFRVQLSNPEFEPGRLALPDFLQPGVPLVTLRRRGDRPGPKRIEPRYDHPEFQRAFGELVDLLAAELDGSSLVEFADLMMYGFWGEGHTSDWESPFPDRALAERTFVDMTRRQMAAWKRVPLVVNTQPDISATGNAAVLDLAMRGGCWLRSDSIVLDEPIQIDQLSSRPPWLAVVMEDGYHRHYRTDDPRFSVDAAGVSVTARLSRAAVLGLAAQARRRDRAGGGLRQRRRGGRARRAARVRGDSGRRGARRRRAGCGTSGRRTAAARILPSSARAGGPGGAAARRDRDQGRAPARALGLRPAARRRRRARGAPAGRERSQMAQGHLMASRAMHAGVMALALAGTTVAAQEVPTPDMLTVLETVEPGPRITPYLRYQLDRAWRQDDQRRAAFEKVDTEADLLALRAQIRARVLDIIGGLPETRTPLDARVTGTIAMDGYRIEKVVFESLPGLHVTALLYVPEEPSGPKPAVLVPCGHAPDGKAFKNYQELAGQLARRGYVVICWDPVGQGERSQFWDAARGRSRYNLVCGEHAVLGNLACIAGTTLDRYMVWDGMRALDYLLTRPDVDARRIAVTGTSGGGFQSLYLGALDERIGVVAPSCFVTSLPMRMANRIFEDPDSDPEQDPYRLVSAGVDHAGLMLLVYPRPIILLAATRDFFPIEGTRKTFREVAALFRVGGHGDRIAMAEGVHGHMYSPENRRAAFAFMDRVNGLPPRDTLDAVKILDAAALRVTPTGQVRVDLPGRSLPEVIREQWRGLPRSSAPPSDLYHGEG